MTKKYINKKNCVMLSFKELKSTEKYCIENINELKGTCDIVYTENQTHGVGRINTNWQSFDGACTFSILLQNQDVSDLQFKTLYLICDILNKNYGVEAYTKWPNDIYIFERKICGIIIDIINDVSIIGIGININSYNNIYYSIKQLTNVNIDKHEFMNTLVSRLKDQVILDCKYIQIPEKIRFNNQVMLAKLGLDMKIILTDSKRVEHIINCNEYSYDIESNVITKKR